MGNKKLTIDINKKKRAKGPKHTIQKKIRSKGGNGSKGGSGSKLNFEYFVKDIKISKNIKFYISNAKGNY